MKTFLILLSCFILAIFISCTQNVKTATSAEKSNDGFDRTVLPIQEPSYATSTVLDARDATPPPRFEVKAPKGAPNVVIVLLDDIGFGSASAFGGPCNMPTLD